jgi:hypothetical protein
VEREGEMAPSSWLARAKFGAMVVGEVYMVADVENGEENEFMEERALTEGEETAEEANVTEGGLLLG